MSGATSCINESRGNQQDDSWSDETVVSPTFLIDSIDWLSTINESPRNPCLVMIHKIDVDKRNGNARERKLEKEKIVKKHEGVGTEWTGTQR